MSTPRTVSPVGLDLIRRFEGFEPDWYLDAVDVRTIGYGWTGELPAGFSAPLTEPEARALLELTVQPYADAVAAAVRVPLAQHEFDALVSFTYNLGPNALRRSTLLQKLNRGEREGAAREFSKWTRAGGRVLAGLVRRRDAEADLFRGRVSASTSTPLAPSTRRAVRGTLRRDTELPDRTLGTLTLYDDAGDVVLVVQTMEPPDRDNARGDWFEAGRVLAGDYRVSPWHSSRFPDTWRLQDTNGREAVLLHKGNWPKNTRGCPLLGTTRADLDGDDVLDVQASGAALDAVNEAFGRDAVWTLTILDTAPVPASPVSVAEGEATDRAVRQLARLEARPPHFLG